MKRIRKTGSVMVIVIICITLCACAVTRSEPKRSYDSSHIADVTEVRAAGYPEEINHEDSEARMAFQEENQVDEEFLDAVNAFSYKTASAILEQTEENANYSPLSLYYALAVAGCGSNGQTQEEILELLGVDTQEELAEQCGRLYRLLYRDNEYSKVKIANSIWLDDEMRDEKVRFGEVFLDSARDNFYASVYLVDFSDPYAGNAMGQWIAENTNGTLAPEITTSEDQVMSLINTIYFQAEWSDRFDEKLTKDDVFYAEDEAVTVPFMNCVDESKRFSEGEHYIRSSLYLKGGSRLVCILPEEGVDIAEFFRSADSVKELFEGGKETCGEVTWQIPKFSFDSEYELNDTLDTLGVKKAFEQSADFSPITDHMLLISNVKQQTHIGIDEKGVLASAFTQMDYEGAEMPKSHAEMILNRPFIYGIVSNTGALLFVGICNNPARAN